MLVFQDLSVHYISKGKKVWTRDEALSQVTQVEIFDSATLNTKQTTELSYVSSMNEPVHWAEIPSRIIRRYVENGEFLIMSIAKMFSSEDAADIKSTDDSYGFNKSFILLTKPSKIFSISSFDGSILWTYFDAAHKIVKIFVE
jgi:hypothetical protein